MAQEVNKVDKEFKGALTSVFNTESGKLALAYLRDQYVDQSAVQETTHITYYRLGQKELIQSIIQLLDEPEELKNIEVIYNNQEV